MSTMPVPGKKTQLRGRQVDAAALSRIRGLLGDRPRRRDLLVEYLHLIQDKFGSISAAHIVALADEMKLASVEVYEVATFYHHFDVTRDDASGPPPLTVRVCDSITCAMFGADHLIEDLESAMAGPVRIQRVPCVGRCHDAPIAVVGTHPVDAATPDRVQEAVRAGRLRASLPPCTDYRQYRAQGGYELLRSLHAGDRTAEQVLGALKDSGLRGLGGAGFPAGTKWEILRTQPGPRLVAVNIDEGEPGTFKDRFYLERDPHRFLEGALIAAWAVESESVYIYLRDEYAACRELLAKEIGALEVDPPCPLPALILRRGAGAYICGEESAMIESIEGKRGMPRLRPPFVAQVGLFGRPTLEHNMETLYWVRDILEKGPAWFSSQGRRGRKGLRSFSLSGRVQRPGVHLAPAGITARELIDEYGGGMLAGHEFYGYFPGGASGGILPAALGDLPLDFDTLNEHGCFIGSAAIIVFSRRDRARLLALNAMRFFRDESCGQCTPCRVGTAKAVSLMEQPHWDKQLLGELAQAMSDASICGLGQAAPNPMLCAMKYFPEEFTGEREH
ncbi:MAG: NAD(P)H-dependent oxidoreductase subunit E [Gammaproteobacteria bacterium]|nr:NAD(P)H-dependent oxidoreductase subunit E [Gammaproteobacteria bacterium]